MSKHYNKYVINAIDEVYEQSATAFSGNLPDKKTEFIKVLEMRRDNLSELNFYLEKRETSASDDFNKSSNADLSQLDAALDARIQIDLADMKMQMEYTQLLSEVILIKGAQYKSNGTVEFQKNSVAATDFNNRNF